jgi:hypothetical protein
LLASASTHFAAALRCAQFVGNRRCAGYPCCQRLSFRIGNAVPHPFAVARRNRVQHVFTTMSAQLLRSGCRCDSASVCKPGGQAGGVSIGGASSSRRAMFWRRDLPGMFFVKFVLQSSTFTPGVVRRLLACSRDLVDPATMPSNFFEDRLQQIAAFQAMHKEICFLCHRVFSI